MVEITVGGRCQLQGSEADVVESLVVSSVFSTTENMFMVLSGYSSLILEMRSFPMPDPVPSPRKWASWKPGGVDAVLARDGGDPVRLVGHHEHRHQRHHHHRGANFVSYFPPGLCECEVGSSSTGCSGLTSFFFNWLRTNDRNTLCEIK